MSHTNHTNRDHDSQSKLLSNLILSHLLKYISQFIYTVLNVRDRILPIYFHRSKCPRYYTTQTINSTNCSFTTVFAQNRFLFVMDNDLSLNSLHVTHYIYIKITCSLTRSTYTATYTRHIFDILYCIAAEWFNGSLYLLPPFYYFVSNFYETYKITINKFNFK